MHELSLLNEVVKTVERYAAENPDAIVYGEATDATRTQAIRSLILEVGELNSAVPDYLKSMWPEAVRGTILDGAALLVENVPAVARCRDCSAEFNFRETRGICPSCNSKNTTLLSGREFYIREISVG